MNPKNMYAALATRNELTMREVMSALGINAKNPDRYYKVVHRMVENNILTKKVIALAHTSRPGYVISIAAGVGEGAFVDAFNESFDWMNRENAERQAKIKRKTAATALGKAFAPELEEPQADPPEPAGAVVDDIDALIEAKYKNVERLKALDKAFLRGRKHIEELESELQSVLPADIITRLHTAYILPTLTAIEAELREMSYDTTSLSLQAVGEA
jgi:hypothetical protein